MDNDYPRMLYRFPSTSGAPTLLQDGAYDTLIVESEDEEDGADGWHRTAADARVAGEAQKVALPTDPPADDTAPPTRSELEAKARELGIPFKGTWGDRKIAEAIAERLKV